ncbi:FG-GAP-like repeat-containing protein [Persicitalea sp.]|uniref:FG-GAP-like repeat-containing protein n=1 Tax=Persicitalea sp. TaxID=3100273 RepID=UPI0035935A12
MHLPKIISIALLVSATPAFAQSPAWQHLSTEGGAIALPGKSQQQTASMIMDLNGDGVNDFVIGFRQVAPALVGYVRTAKGWDKWVLDPEFLTVEAGGAHYDIDGDGDEDLVFGGDSQSPMVWWWENPGKMTGQPWERHVIKDSGKHQHHDQAFGDFKRTGNPQLVFWNQQAKALFLADIPTDPKAEPWPLETIFSGEAGEKKSWYAEGVATADVDGDGWIDLLAGNYWFKYLPETKEFQRTRLGEEGGRVAVGKFKPGPTRQVLISPGDGTGRLMFYEYMGEEDKDMPTDATQWKARDLIGRELIHSHTLEVADLNNDGHLDVFVAEMAKWGKQAEPDNPDAEAWILYGDGAGNFTKELFKKGWDFHEARVADLDGDGDQDILGKPYTWKAPRLDVWLQNGVGKKIDLSIAQKKIGLELYSFRDRLKDDVPGTLAAVRKMGFTEVEVPAYYGLTPEQFKQELDKAGLKATGALFPFERFSDDVDGLIREAKVLGLKQIGCAWIPHLRLFTQTDADKGIAVFNQAGAKLKAAGIRFYYHAHGYEFRPLKGTEGTLFDYMAERMKPGVADFQLDVYWALHGGADPARLLRRYPGRFLSLHLKDMAYGQLTGLYTGGAPLENDCIHGKGQQDFRRILEAAIETKVPYYYIEDENAAAFTQVPQSLAYLRGLR